MGPSKPRGCAAKPTSRRSDSAAPLPTPRALKAPARQAARPRNAPPPRRSARARLHAPAPRPFARRARPSGLSTIGKTLLAPPFLPHRASARAPGAPSRGSAPKHLGISARHSHGTRSKALFSMWAAAQELFTTSSSCFKGFNPAELMSSVGVPGRGAFRNESCLLIVVHCFPFSGTNSRWERKTLTFHKFTVKPACISRTSTRISRSQPTLRQKRAQRGLTSVQDTVDGHKTSS